MVASSGQPSFQVSLDQEFRFPIEVYGNFGCAVDGNYAGLNEFKWPDEV